MTSIWVHDTADSGRRGLTALVERAGHAALPLPDLSADHDFESGRDPEVVAAVVAVRTCADRALIAELRERHTTLPVLALPLDAQPIDCADLITIGATGALPWESPAGRLEPALAAVIAGCNVMPPATHVGAGWGTESLSKSDVELLRSLASDTTVDELALRSAVGRRTMYRHLGELYRKLGAANRHDAIAEARRRHLI